MNETKNKFESQMTKSETRPNEMTHEIKYSKQDTDPKCEKKKDDNCLIN